MSTADELSRQARAAQGQADELEALASRIESRRPVLEGRLDGLVQHHTDAVWASDAASRSRNRLREHSTTVTEMGATLGTVILRLRTAAEIRHEEQGRLNRAANQAAVEERLEALDAEAATATATTPTAPTTAPNPLSVGGHR